jgi:hypothetical protein
MLIQFKESFQLPVEEIFEYFSAPKHWPSLYGLTGRVREHGNGWYSIPLQNFPFPLIARNVVCLPNEFVKWEFRGFWKGEGEIRLKENQTEVMLEGYETISVRWLFFLSPIVEKLFLERQFTYIWQLGWKRLRKKENQIALKASDGKEETGHRIP